MHRTPNLSRSLLHRIFLSLSFLGLWSFPSWAQDSEITRSDDYAVRRFQEVISAAEQNESLPPTEALIQLRARLVLTEKKIEEARSEKEAPETRPQHIRALQAELDHYKIRIRKLEDRILEEKRKELPKKKTR